MNYGFVIDNSACIGCHACSTACKSENQVPLGVNRTWVKYTEIGQYPDVRRSFQVTRCNHCSNPPCVRICPTGAMYQRSDGIVEFNTDSCIACKACTQACPYDAIYIDPEQHTAAKCHFCSHRTDIGLEPACVVVCPEHAIIAGDLDDPESEISRVLAKHNTTVRKPEQGTAPKLFYIEGHDVSMHPTAVPRTPDSFMFADVLSLHPGQPVHAPGFEPTPGADFAGSTNPEGTQLRAPQPQGQPVGGPLNVGSRQAAHMVQVGYTGQHEIQWHWPIPAYIITKHLAGGIFFWLALTALLPSLAFDPAWFVGAGAFAIVMQLVTLALLIYDLDRPDRFFFLLTRPQWRSWVARAAWILSAFSAVTGLWWAAETAGWLGLFDVPEVLRVALALPTIPTAILAATYTAFLFAQAEGRDLWQSSHVPVQMFAQFLVFAGLPFAAFGPWTVETGWLAIGGLGLSLVATLAGDLWIAHPSEVARRAAEMITEGDFRHHFWWGGLALGHVVPLALLVAGLPMAAAVAGVSAVIGLFLYAYAFVMAPQEIPNS